MAFFNTILDDDGAVSETRAAFIPSSAANSPFAIVNRSNATVRITISSPATQITFNGEDEVTTVLEPGDFHFGLVNNTSSEDHSMTVAAASTHGTGVHTGGIITTLL